MNGRRDSAAVPAPAPRLRRFVALGLVAPAAVVGCGDEGGDAEEFCAGLATHAPVIMKPQIATDEDIGRYVAIFEDLGDRVPLAIEEEWSMLTHSLQTAASVPPGDAAAQQAALEEAYSTQEAGQTVLAWVASNCGMDLGTLGPVANYDPNATTTTTIPGAPPSTAGG